MPDNRIDITIQAQNLAQAAFKRLQTDLLQSNQALQKSGQAAQQGSGGLNVYRDELGRFHEAVTGRFVSAARLLKDGFTEVERGTDDSTEAFKRSNPAITQLRNEYNFLRDSVHNAAGVTRRLSTAFTNQLKTVIDSAVEFERLRKSLTTISDSAAEANKQYERLIEVSRLPGLNLSQALRASVQLQAIGQSGEAAANAITQFGNALALGGGSARDLNQITNAIRQMSAEGKILQEDLSIMTTRLAVLVPVLKDEFGGTRAKDIRDYFDSFNVPASEQAAKFLEIVLARLSELPRAGETAANAIENLGDTAERTQAAIGSHLLPAVKDFTGSLEGLLLRLENAPPELQKVIAIGAVLGTTFITVTAGATALTAALPALAGALTFLAANPIGIAITAIALLTAGIIAWKVATEGITTAQEDLQNAIQSGDLGEVAAARQVIVEQLREERSELERLNALYESSLNASSSAIRRGESADPEQIQQRIENVTQRIGNLESAANKGDSAVSSALAASEPEGTTRDFVTRPIAAATEATAVQNASFSLNVEGQLSASDVTAVQSAVASLQQLGENQEVPQVLRDLNAAMEGAHTSILNATTSVKSFNPFLFTAAEAFEAASGGVKSLNLSLDLAALTIPRAVEAFGLPSAIITRIQDDLGAIFDLAEAAGTTLGPLAAQFDISAPDVGGIRRGESIAERQAALVAQTGAADLTSGLLPNIEAEADPDRDTFLGAFNATPLISDITNEAQEIGFDLAAAFGQSFVSGFSDNPALQGLGEIVALNVTEQIYGAINDRFLDGEGLASALAGIGGAGLGLGALALGGGHLLEGIFGALTPDETAAREAREAERAEREAQGIQGGGVIPLINTNNLSVLGVADFQGPTTFSNLDTSELVSSITQLFEGTDSIFDTGNLTEAIVDSVQFQNAIIESVVLDDESISQAIKDGFDEADQSPEEAKATADAIALAFGFTPKFEAQGQVTDATRIAELFNPGGQVTDPERITELFDTGKITDAPAALTGLSQEDLDLVSLNVAELLQGTRRVCGAVRFRSGAPGGRARRSYGCGCVQFGRSCGGFGYRECVSGFLWGAGYLRVERSVLR